MKKLLMSLTAIGLLFVPGKVEAYTVSEIAATGSCVSELLNGTNAFDSMLVSSTGYASFRQSGSYLVIDGMYEGIGGGFFNVSGSTISLDFVEEDDTWRIPGLSNNYIYASVVSTDTGMFAIVPLWYTGTGYSYYTMKRAKPEQSPKMPMERSTFNSTDLYNSLIWTAMVM